MPIRYYIISLKHFLKRIFFKSKKNENLPETVKPDEELARNLIGGSSSKSLRKIYNPKTNEVKPSQFLDTRNPRELSVNRISTIDVSKAHELGLELKNEINNNNPNQSEKVYHGYGSLFVQACLDAGCSSVEKEDYDGKKPYHANILYPEKEKFEEMEIANILAFKAKLVKYGS